ncbi:adenosine receptor A2b-like [Acanthaster planci]|uniref:Adenosine receptor A2b-like n=1 Tax=Acanthaster planci TaxID=133434 RepID=A0A8B7ZJN5_ACAPL|nr:adenosine receptor A2b-like [Acanthaster planci]
MDPNNVTNPTCSSSIWLTNALLPELEYVFFCVQVALSIIGILGNSLVCITIAKATFMHNVTNFLIAHLAVADILVCVTIIIFQERYMYMYVCSPDLDNNTAMNEILCKFFHGKRIIWAACNISIFSMVGVTVERYVGIVHPLKYPRLFTQAKVGLMIAVIWTISLSLKIPYLVVSSYDSSTHQCFKEGLSNTNTTVASFTSILEFVLPAVILLGCYRKILISLQRAARNQQQDNNHAPANELLVARRRVIKMLLVVAMIYILIWLPIYCLFWISISSKDLSFEVYHASKAIKPTVAVFNSVVNPFVYAFKYKEFQRGVRYHVFPSMCRSRKVTAAVITVMKD